MTELPTNEPMKRFQIADDAPLRLADAARLAFPAGGMTAAGLRREAARGRLTIERIAGKDFTTLAAIEKMRVLCRVPPKEVSHLAPLSSARAPQRALAADSPSIAMEAARLKLQELMRPPRVAPSRRVTRRAKSGPAT
jgi:hypothetical protein